MQKKVTSYSIVILSTGLGLFFIYKGLNKHFLLPCKTYGPDSTLPVDYKNLMTALCSSGFTKVVGFIEILSGILLLIPRTRILGILFLTPVIVTIFLFHLLIDNRPHELIETGIPLVLTLTILAWGYTKWKGILDK